MARPQRYVLRHGFVSAQVAGRLFAPPKRDKHALSLEKSADQFTPPPHEVAFVRGREVVPSDFEFYRKYRSTMGAKSHTATRDVDYPDAPHTLTIVKEPAGGNTCPCD